MPRQCHADVTAMPRGCHAYATRMPWEATGSHGKPRSALLLGIFTNATREPSSTEHIFWATNEFLVLTWALVAWHPQGFSVEPNPSPGAH